MTSLSTINPFYAARGRYIERRSPPAAAERIYAIQPQAPRTASPVPPLTSLYHNAVAGDYGDRGYPGNCGGNLIKDLLRYFKSRSWFDPMTGSGTWRAVWQ